MRPLRIIVAHPGEQHARRAAVGLQTAGMLAQYVTSFYYKKNGSWASCLTHLPTNIARRLEAEFCRRRNPEINDSLVRPIIPIHELFCVMSTRSGLSEKTIMPLKRWRNRRFDKQIAALVKRESPDAVIVYDSAALQTLSQCRTCTTVGILDQTVGHITAWKQLLEEEMELHPKLFANGDIPLPSNRLVEVLTEEALSADWILAGSEYTKNTLVRIGVSPEKIKIIPYGADTRRFTPIEPEQRNRRKKFTLLFVGGIGVRKGVHYLLEAVRQLNHPQIELLLAGNIEGAKRWLANYEGQFRHIPFVTHDKLCEIYRASDVFVFPSLHEGFGMVLNEAVASGLPVIGTPHTGVPDMLNYGRCGFVVPIRDVEQLKLHIMLLLEDQHLYQEMSVAARNVAQHFSWEKYSERLVNLMKSAPCQNH